MAIPMIPLMLLGVGVVVLSRRKRSSKKKDESRPKAPFIVPQAVVYIPPPKGPAPTGPSGEPGQPCKVEGGEGAWDELGHCKTFWIDGDTDEAIRRLAREEWEAQGRPTFSQLCLALDPPDGDELSVPEPNPLFIAIVSKALQRYYDVGPLFPPKVAHQFHEPTSPYWVHKAWARAMAVVQQELCPA